MTPALLLAACAEGRRGPEVRADAGARVDGGAAGDAAVEGDGGGTGRDAGPVGGDAGPVGGDAGPRCVADADCDDGLACNGVETCDASGATPGDGCRAGVAVTCDDGLACTTDTCSEPAGTCTHVGTDADGDGYVAVGCGAGDDCDDGAAGVNPGAAEVCDGVDNDCSGAADDGPGMACVLGSAPISCTTGCGTAGSRACSSLCQLSPCVAATETCNGCDDDGNGLADDGFACVRGSSRSCTTACGTAGTQACNGSCSGYGPCYAATEICGNGCDDDGDGLVDEGCTTNDTCGSAIVLAPSGGTRTDAFAGATATVTDCASGAELWYRITLSSRTILYLDTFGSSFDTKLSVRSACGGAALQCEDDDCGVLQDQLVRELADGTYYIALHAFSSATTSGTASLRWQTITPGNGPATRFTGNGTYAGTTSGTGITSGCTGSGPENLHYFTMCPGATSTVTATTCSLATWDTVLYIRGSGDVQLACNDDSCSLQSSTSAAVTGPGLYGIYVDGWGSASGSYSVTVGGL